MGTFVLCGTGWSQGSLVAPASALNAPPPSAEERALQDATAKPAVTAADAPPAAPALAKEPPWIQGWASLRFRSRWTDEDSDHDAYAVIALDYGAARHAPFSAHVMGRVAADLDGKGSEASEFWSLEDASGAAVTGELYHAYVDWAPEGSKLAVRAGRHVDASMPEFMHLDGITLRTEPLGSSAVEVGAYGGLPVHLYRYSSTDDREYGTWLEAQPWKGGRARFDWMHLEDEQLLGAFQDDLLGLGLWQTLGSWSADAQYSMLEQESRDLRIGVQQVDAKSGAVARVTYFELFETQRASTLETDPFTSSLQEYFPFREGGATYSRPIGRHLDVDLGADVRRVRDDGDVGEYNRDWERYRATLTVREFGVRGLSIGLTADRWDGDDRDESTWGADATLAPDAEWQFTLGSDYALYKYDLYSQSERDDVRTYYLRARCKPNETISLELAYEYEDADFEQYQFVRWGVLWRF